MGRVLSHVTEYQNVTNAMDKLPHDVFSARTAVEMMERDVLSQTIHLAQGHQHFDWAELGASVATAGIMGGNYAKGVTDIVNTHLGTSGKIATSELNSLSQGALTGSISHNGFNAKDILIDNLGSAIGNSALDTLSVRGQQQTVDAASQALETLMIEQTGMESLVNGAVEGFNREVEAQAAWRDDNQVPWREIAYEGIYTALDLQPKSVIPSINNESWVEKNNQAWTDNDPLALLGLTGNAIYGPFLGQGALNIVTLPLLDRYQHQSIKFKNTREVWNTLNAKYDTAIDFNFLSIEEGKQKLQGYLPMNDGNVIDQSGITIATGFDIGQCSKKELKDYGFSSDLEEKLMPFVGAKKEEAKKLLPLAKQTTLTTREANEVDFIIKNDHMKKAIDDWNKNRLKDTPMFHELSPAKQTVLMCRAFHQGPAFRKTKVAENFYNKALKNDWVSAENHLRNYNVKGKWYKDRVNNEANLLKRERLNK